MRQKTISFIFDKIMWYILYFLPIIIMIVTSINGTPTDIVGTLELLGISPSTNNVIYTTLTTIFGGDGIIELFIDSGLFMYLTYFVSCYICHFVIDLSLFVLKLSRKFIDNVVGGIE